MKIINKLVEEDWDYFPIFKADNIGVFALVELAPSVVVFGNYNELEVYTEECFSAEQTNENTEVIRLK